MSIIIGGSALNSCYYNTAYGVCTPPVQTVSPPSEATYVSLVKRVGLDWKIEMHESRDKQKHLNYIESLRGNPNVEVAKVLQFVKIAEITNVSTQSKGKSNEPDLDKIL